MTELTCYVGQCINNNRKDNCCLLNRTFIINTCFHNTTTIHITCSNYEEAKPC